MTWERGFRRAAGRYLLGWPAFEETSTPGFPFLKPRSVLGLAGACQYGEKVSVDMQADTYVLNLTGTAENSKIPFSHLLIHQS
jgi:hypothetical protein